MLLRQNGVNSHRAAGALAALSGLELAIGRPPPARERRLSGYTLTSIAVAYISATPVAKPPMAFGSSHGEPSRCAWRIR